MLKSKGIISPFQKKIIFLLKDIPDISYFYLTGGTALSEFYLGHRRSYDMDFFTSESGLIPSFSYLVEKELKNKAIEVKVVRRFTTFAEFELIEKKEEMRFHLAYDSPFRFEMPVISDLGIKINDYKDLIVDKLLAFFGRTEPRDAVDLFFILKREDIWKMIKLAHRKDPGFDLYWLAIALERSQDFPDDIEKWPVEMLKEANAKEIKKYFSILARKILTKLKEK